MRITDMSTFIKSHLSWMRVAGFSPRSVGDRAEVLRRLDAELPHGLNYAADVELQDWLGCEDWSAWTRVTYFNHALGYYTWAVDHELLTINPMDRMRRPRAQRGDPRPVSDQQFAHVLQVAIEPWRTFVILAAGAGLRCCEIAQLRREDVDQNNLTIRKGKGGKLAVLATHPLIWSTVEHFPAGLLAEHLGVPADARWISQRGALYFRRKLKMPGVSLHRFRAWYAGAVRDTGADAFVVQGAMRHANLNTTLSYVRARAAEGRQAVTALRFPAAA